MNVNQLQEDQQRVRDLMWATIEKMERNEITDRRAYTMACCCGVVLRSYAIQGAPSQYGTIVLNPEPPTIHDQDAA